MTIVRPEFTIARPTLETCYQAAAGRQSERRLLHTLGVCHAAATLATLRGVDVGAAAIAGLLHDMAKETPPDVLRADLKRRGRPLDPEELDFPSLWHATAGAVWAEQDLGISELEILEAIRLHPTLDADAGPLAQLVYLADYTEPTRQWNGVEALRRRARSDFSGALVEALERKMKNVTAKHGKAHPRARRALEGFLSKTKS